MRHMIKAGALLSGHTPRGRVIHAVDEADTYCGPALCGAKPAIQWAEMWLGDVSCAKCAKQLEKRRVAALGGGK